MDKRMRESLDRHITGNYGEDQFQGEMEDEEDEFCTDDCKKCKMKVNYTMFDQEDDGDLE